VEKQEGKKGKPGWSGRLAHLKKSEPDELIYLGPNKTFPVKAGDAQSYLAAFDRAKQHGHTEIAAKALARGKRMGFAWALHHKG